MIRYEAHYGQGDQMTENSFQVIEHTAEEDNSTYLYVVDESLAELREHELLVHTAFEKLAEKHIKASKGLLSLLPFDPDRYPFQRLDVVEARVPKPADQKVLESFATAAYPEFPSLKRQFLKPQNNPVFGAVAEGLAVGQNYSFLFDHGRIINVPLGQVAIQAGIQQAAERLEEEVPEYYSRLTVSRQLACIRAFGLPAMQVLTQQGIVGMSIPPSRSVKNAGISLRLLSRYNRSFKEIREHPQLTEPNNQELPTPTKPVVDFLAGSGTADVYVSRFLAKKKQPSAAHMGPASRGVVGLLRNSRVVTVSVNVDHSHPKSAIGTVHKAPADETGLHMLMTEVADLAQQATHVRHQYHITSESFREATEKIRFRHRGDKEDVVDD